MTLQHTGPVKCPHCGTPNDAIVAVDGIASSPDDRSVSLCASCLGVAMYVCSPVGLALRVLTAVELVEVEADPLLIATRVDILAHRAASKF